MTGTRAAVAMEMVKILEDDGWCQGRMHRGDGKHCIVGALLMAAARFGLADKEEERSPELDRLWRELIAHLGLTANYDLPRWNDAPERTAEQVIKELRAFAEESV